VYMFTTALPCACSISREKRRRARKGTLRSLHKKSIKNKQWTERRGGCTNQHASTPPKNEKKRFTLAKSSVLPKCGRMCQM
jgi:hypothetical protein